MRKSAKIAAVALGASAAAAAVVRAVSSTNDVPATPVPALKRQSCPGMHSVKEDTGDMVGRDPHP